MVVLFLIGLLAAVVVVSLPGDESKLRAEAERLAARTSAARDEAITAATPVALVLSDAGYYFEKRVAGQWQPLAEGRMGQTGWGEGTTAVQEGGQSGRSRIVFDPVGLASGDAAVRLSRNGRVLVVRIARDGQVRIDAGN